MQQELNPLDQYKAEDQKKSLIGAMIGNIVLWILPGIYIGLRFCLGIPLILIVRWNN